MLVFWQHGYETTSITDLTAAMGVTAPSIYTAFGDKKRLFLEAARLYAGPIEDVQARLDAAPTARDAAWAMLQAAVVAFTGETTPKGCLLASATATGSTGSADVQRALAEIRLEITQRLAARISQDVDAGRQPETPSAASLAAMVMALIQGMSVLARDGLDRIDLARMADVAMAAWPIGPARV